MGLPPTPAVQTIQHAKKQKREVSIQVFRAIQNCKEDRRGSLPVRSPQRSPHPQHVPCITVEEMGGKGNHPRTEATHPREIGRAHV